MYKVLIVDDSALMRKMIENKLRNLGMPIDGIVHAGDGVEALDVLKDVGSVDLILSDMNMPNMNGLELVKALKDSASTTPVVLITTEGHEEPRIAEAIACGARLVNKPFTPAQLKDTVSGALKLAS